MSTAHPQLAGRRRATSSRVRIAGTVALTVLALSFINGAAQAQETGELRLPNPDGRDRAFDESRRDERIEIEFFDARMGASHTLADFPAELRIVNYWATWCVPCLRELPSLAAISREYPESSVRVIAISLDRADVNETSGFISQLGLVDFSWFVDASRASGAAADIVALPTTIIVDNEGRELGRLVGPADWASPEARRLIDSFIGPQSQ